MVKTDELKNQLDKEIENREDLETRFKELLKNYNFFKKTYKNDMKTIKKIADNDKRGFDIKIKKVEKIRDQILEHTLQIVSIVVAILAIIMTFSFLSTEFYSCPNQLVWFLVGAIGYFLIIFTLWVLMWHKNRKIN